MANSRQSSQKESVHDTARLHKPASRSSDAAPSRRLSTETKSSFKTTQFWVYVLVVGVLIASYVVKTTGSQADYFRAGLVLRRAPDPRLPR